MNTKNHLVNYYLACHYNAMTIGQAKKLLIESKKYDAKDIDDAAKIAAQELLKTRPKKVKEVDVETVLQNRKTNKTTIRKNNFNALFWLISTAFILIIIALVYLYSIKQKLS